MNFIKKIFDKEIDDSVHLQFQKFSKGEFRNRAIVKIKKSAGKFNISTTAEFANDFVRAIAKKLGENKTNITGAIVSTSDLTGELDFQDKKQFQGVKRYIIKKEMSGDEVIKLMDKFPKSFFALSFETSEDKLKIKPKAPKSGKPGKEGALPKPDFCNLKTTDTGIGKSFVFEKLDFKEANVGHHYFITDLILPEGEKDFAKIREMAKRKGRIVREAVIDGEEIKSEMEFEA